MNNVELDANAKIYVAGHRGLVGSAIVRNLLADGHHNLLLRTHEELDLTDQPCVEDFFRKNRPQFVFMAAAKVGGIQANNCAPAEFIRDNLAIQTNVIHSGWKFGVSKLLFLGSSCVYPKVAPQPLHEEYLLDGPLEPTNEWYAVAKIAGIKTCQAYRRQYGFNAICAMPTNLYGPHDNFDPVESHVVPGLIRRLHDAKNASARSVAIWGTGRPLRELLYVDDAASALVLLMKSYNDEAIINVGSGEEVSVAQLAQRIANVVGYCGELQFDDTKPDGTPRKLLSGERLKALGWKPSVPLTEGLARTYSWFTEHQSDEHRDQT